MLRNYPTLANAWGTTHKVYRGNRHYRDATHYKTAHKEAVKHGTFLVNALKRKETVFKWVRA